MGQIYPRFNNTEINGSEPGINLPNMSKIQPLFLISAIVFIKHIFLNQKNTREYFDNFAITKIQALYKIRL